MCMRELSIDQRFALNACGCILRMTNEGLKKFVGDTAPFSVH